MVYVYTLMIMICASYSLDAMQAKVSILTYIKTTLDDHVAQELTDQNSRAYNTLLDYVDFVDPFLETHPEYAQQIADIIITNIAQHDTPPITAERTIIRLIDFKKLFLGHRTDKELKMALKEIN